MLKPANPREARTAMMAITTRSSTRVKPQRLERVGLVCVMDYFLCGFAIEMQTKRFPVVNATIGSSEYTMSIHIKPTGQITQRLFGSVYQ